MSFLKTGSPQPLEIVSEMCEECGKNKAQFNVNGKFICSECKLKIDESK
jgi:hypothetical protein